MRIALAHDWLDTWRGGERVLAELCRIYSTADLFALVDFLPDSDRSKLGNRGTTTTFLQRLPLARRAFRGFLPLFPRAIETLDVSAYDLVISTSHAVAKGVRTHRRQLHICYCFSPMRYAWDLRETYLRQAGLEHGARGWLTRRTLDRICAWDRAASERVDHFVAISRHIAERIRRCYGRDSTVIYPPAGNEHIELRGSDLTTSDRPGSNQPTSVQSGGEPPTNARRRSHDTYVTVSQLVAYKRVDLIVEAFRSLPDRQLIVIGDGPERTAIAALAGSNVRMLGRVSDRERDDWLRRASAFVFAAEEDFGIAPLEAQALGTPVIALARGGAVETIHGLDHTEPTGVLYADQTAGSIVDAVRTFETHRSHIDPAACVANARRFSPERFRDEFDRFVRARWSEFVVRRTAP